MSYNKPSYKSKISAKLKTTELCTKNTLKLSFRIHKANIILVKINSQKSLIRKNSRTIYNCQIPNYLRKRILGKHHLTNACLMVIISIVWTNAHLILTESFVRNPNLLIGLIKKCLKTQEDLVSPEEVVQELHLCWIETPICPNLVEEISQNYKMKETTPIYAYLKMLIRSHQCKSIWWWMLTHKTLLRLPAK